MPVDPLPYTPSQIPQLPDSGDPRDMIDYGFRVIKGCLQNGLISGVVIQSAEPVDPPAGLIWFDTDDGVNGTFKFRRSDGWQTLNFANATDGSGFIQKDISAGGNIVLTNAEAALGNIEFIGVLSANTTIVYPAVPHLVFAKNSATGAFTVTVKTPLGTGETIAYDATKLLVVDDNVNAFVSGGGGGGTLLTIEEVDGAPSVAATKLVFPNGTLSNASGVVTYTPAPTGSGGGSSSGSVLPLDVPPSSPSVWDDDFNGSALDSKWSAINSQASTITFEGGCLVMEPVNTGTNSIAKYVCGLRQTSPSGSFEVRAKLNWNRIGNDTEAGIAVGRELAKFKTCGVHQNSSMRWISGNYSESADWSGYDGSFGEGVKCYSWAWVKITWNASTSTMTYSASNDGFRWFDFGSQSGQLQPTDVCLVLYSNSGTVAANSTVYFDWFRIQEFQAPLVVTATSYYEQGSTLTYQPLNAYPGNAGYWLSLSAPSVSVPQALAYLHSTTQTFSSYTLDVINTYDPVGRAPKDWTVEARNLDSDSWTVLDTRSGIVFNSSTPQTFNFASAQSYKQFRLNVTASGSGGYVTVNEWKLNA